MSYISTKNEIEDFYFFENKVDALKYCQRLANCLFVGSVDGKEQYVSEQMRELSDKIRSTNGQRADRNVSEFDSFLKDCLLWLSQLPSPKVGGFHGG